MARKKRVKKRRAKAKAKGPAKKDELKKYPGYYFAIAAGLILVVAYLFLAANGVFNERSEAAKAWSEDARLLLDLYTEDIDSALEGDFSDSLEDDYLLSWKSEFEWMQQKEREAYNSFPLGDAEYREGAILLFLDYLITMNETVSYDFGEADYDSQIEYARSLEFETPDIITPELDQLNFDEGGLAKVRGHFNGLMADYLAEKRLLLETLESRERKYVEAKKIIYASFLGSE